MIDESGYIFHRSENDLFIVETTLTNDKNQVRYLVAAYIMNSNTILKIIHLLQKLQCLQIHLLHSIWYMFALFIFVLSFIAVFFKASDSYIQRTYRTWLCRVHCHFYFVAIKISNVWNYTNLDKSYYYCTIRCIKNYPKMYVKQRNKIKTPRQR